MSNQQCSRIFVQNRALGYVSNSVPHVVRYIKKRKENLVVTCVGRAFHTYGCDRFSLLSVSPLHSHDINCISGDAFLIYTACDNDVYAWRRGFELKHTYKGHTRPVHLLLPFGPHLISIDEASHVNVWEIRTGELYIELNFDNTIFEISSVCHPHTYLNKILLGSEQGGMQLWNIKTGELVHTFLGWSCKITVLQQSPFVNVIGIGLENGRIILYNIKLSETLVEFKQDWGSVTALSFRSDMPIVASGSSTGNIVFWDMKEQKVASHLHAHSSEVTGLTYLPGEPVLVTSSPDNSLKMWIFDTADGSGRLLKKREGHNSPPTFIRFYDELGKNILSAGNDSTVRIFNLVTEIANKSLGQASYNRSRSKKKHNPTYLKMPRITRFCAGIPNNIEFDDIATIHENSPLVTTWSFNYARMSEVHLIHERFKQSFLKKQISGYASCVCFSRCMNFVIIGYSTGHLDKFNVQSGNYRGSYGETTAHRDVVRGVTTDNLNKLVISGGVDHKLRFWIFATTGKPCFSEIELSQEVSFFSSHHESSLLAVAFEDFSIILVDLEFRNIVREFKGHTGIVTDVTFSPDARWLVSSSMDGSIKTWDIPSSFLIDCIRVSVPCISLSFSPTGEYLATIHVDHYGVYLWSNKTLFAHISLTPITDVTQYQPVLLSAFESVAEEPTENIDTDTEDSKEQIEDLITLTQYTSTKWQNVLDIDLIKKRNRPKQPPKKPQEAPFFLPTVPSLSLQFDLSNMPTENGEKSNCLTLTHEGTSTAFGKMLENTLKTNDFIPVIKKLVTFGIISVSLEVESLAPEQGGSVQIMIQFLKMIEYMFKLKKDFELAQSYLAIFLKTHFNVLKENSDLMEYVDRLRHLQDDTWQMLESKLSYCLSVTNHMRMLH